MYGGGDFFAGIKGGMKFQRAAVEAKKNSAKLIRLSSAFCLDLGARGCYRLPAYYNFPKYRFNAIIPRLKGASHFFG
jgi:hypothetical protein